MLEMSFAGESFVKVTVNFQLIVPHADSSEKQIENV